MDVLGISNNKTKMDSYASKARIMMLTRNKATNVLGLLFLCIFSFNYSLSLTTSHFHMHMAEYSYQQVTLSSEVKEREVIK